jgi:hypothetical protein
MSTCQKQQEPFGHFMFGLTFWQVDFLEISLSIRLYTKIAFADANIPAFRWLVNGKNNLLLMQPNKPQGALLKGKLSTIDLFVITS